MKRIICYLRTVWEFDTFIMAWINFGAIFVAHRFVEVSNKNRKQVLRCKTCGYKSVGYYGKQL